MAPTAHVPLDDLHLLLIHYLYEARLPASLATLAAETGVRAALAPAGLSDALRSGDWAAAVAALAPPTTLPEPLVADIAEAAYLHLVDGGVGGGTSGTAAVELLATAAPLRRLRTSDPVRHAALVALPATLARARAAAATPSSSSIPSVSVYDLPGWGPAPAERGAALAAAVEAAAPAPVPGRLLRLLHWGLLYEAAPADARPPVTAVGWGVDEARGQGGEGEGREGPAPGGGGGDGGGDGTGASRGLLPLRRPVVDLLGRPRGAVAAGGAGVLGCGGGAAGAARSVVPHPSAATRVTAVAVLPSGIHVTAATVAPPHLLTGCSDGTLRSWAVSTGVPAGDSVVVAPSAAVTAVAVAPTRVGRLATAAGASLVGWRWRGGVNPSAPRQLWTVTLPAAGVAAVAWHPGGGRLAAATAQGVVVVGAAAGVVLASCPLGGDAAVGVAWLGGDTSGGDLLVAATASGTVSVVDEAAAAAATALPPTVVTWDADGTVTARQGPAASAIAGGTAIALGAALVGVGGVGGDGLSDTGCGRVYGLRPTGELVVAPLGSAPATVAAAAAAAVGGVNGVATEPAVAGLVVGTVKRRREDAGGGVTVGVDAGGGDVVVTWADGPRVSVWRP
ncbi:hypothetical protein MMPV_004052 [Pyropia vietnamensis]